MKVYVRHHLDWKIPPTNFVNIDPWDTWSLDTTLAQIIAPALQQLKEKQHGSPHVDDEDVPEHLRSSNAPPTKFEGDTDALWHERWEWVLNEMIFAFNAIKDGEYDQPFYTKKEDGHFDIDMEGLRVLEDRITNGTRLFGKYYRGLWD